MKKTALLSISIISVLVLTLSLSVADTKTLYFSETGTDPCSITINQDLSFTIPNAVYDAGPLGGQTALSIDFQYFGEQNGQLKWKLADISTPSSSSTCSVTIDPDLSFSLANAIYDAGPLGGQTALEAGFQYSGEQNGFLLWYLADFTLDKRPPRTSTGPATLTSLVPLMDATKYDPGINPRVAINNWKGRDVVVEVHQSIDDYYLHSYIGILSEDGTAIDWGVSHKYDTGEYPSVAVNKRNLVVEVHKSENHDTLWYTAGLVDADNKKMLWDNSHQYDDGVQPAVALNDNLKVVEVHKSQNEDTLWYRVGTFDPVNFVVNWGPSRQYDTGQNPSVAINDNDEVVEVHQSENEDTLWYNTGRIVGDTVEWSGSTRYDAGILPTVTLDNVGNVVEFHRSENEKYVWYNVGALESGGIAWKVNQKTVLTSWRHAIRGVALSSTGRIVYVQEPGDGLESAVFKLGEPPFSLKAMRTNELYDKAGNAFPDVAIIPWENGDAVLQVHNCFSFFGSDLCYLVGIRREGQEYVDWGASHKYDTGRCPAVAMDNSGLVVEVHESQNEDTLWYRVGVIDVDTRRVSWGASHKYDTGKYPDVAINNNQVVVEVHQSENEDTLWYHVGTIDKENSVVNWGPSRKYDTGIFPSVAINDKNEVVEAHRSENEATVWYHTGRIVGDTVEWGPSRKYDTGWGPKVALDNAGNVVEFHPAVDDEGWIEELAAIADPKDLWYHTGRLNMAIGRIEWGPSINAGYTTYIEDRGNISGVPSADLRNHLSTLGIALSASGHLMVVSKKLVLYDDSYPSSLMSFELEESTSDYKQVRLPFPGKPFLHYSLYRLDGEIVLWATGTDGNPGAYYAMQDDGNFVIYSASDEALWASETEGNPGATLNMQDDGNLVIYSASGEVLWATGTDGNPGAYYAMQDDGNFVVYRKSRD